MSRVGRKVITVPKDVKVSVGKTALEVQGPKGKLQTPVPPGISFALNGAELQCQRSSDARQQSDSDCSVHQRRSRYDR